METGSRNRPKGPGVVYSAVATAMLLLVGIVALTASQPPPPSIAEFAPQAQEQIDEAPAEQSSRFGSGDGDCPPGALYCEELGVPTPADDTVEPPPPDIDVPRVRRCVGDPPRQIEDPQSPPCVPYWDGDNGGATWPGVTENEIRVVIPGNYSDIEALVPFFNRRFEFYGRKLVITDTSTEQGSEPADQSAAARDARDRYDAFASTHNGNGNDTSIAYTTELARQKIIYTTHEGPIGQEYHQARHPYFWQYPAEADLQFQHLGRWACNRLAGSDARFAGANGVQMMSQDTRVFGVVLHKWTETMPLSPDPLVRELERCGAKPPEGAVIESDSPGGEGTNILVRMKEAGVTTIYCLCQFVHAGLLGQQATSQSYFPEWLIGSYHLMDSNTTGKTGFPREQRERMFGLTFHPKQVRAENLPAVWARKEVDPGYTPTLVDGLNNSYRNLLLLASGIQMAGPDLTPETFERGLHQAAFPNPFHPIMAGKVGFGGGSHAMTIDAAEIWWSETARNPYADSAGAFCYVNGGERYRLDDYRSGDEALFFNGDCDSGM